MVIAKIDNYGLFFRGFLKDYKGYMQISFFIKKDKITESRNVNNFYCCYALLRSSVQNPKIQTK